MKILTCIFSYNRPALLANCTRSVENYFPWGDRLILDDGSDSPLVDLVLDHWRQRPNWRVVKFERDETRTKNKRLGGFYINMGYALSYARNHGYDYCFFLEEDSQFVWRDNGFPNRMSAFFERCDDAIQMSPLFLERFINFSLMEFIQELGAYRTPRGFNTTGIWHLDRVRAIRGFRFVDGTAPTDPESNSYLPMNSRQCLEAGYRFYWLQQPIIMRNMWVNYAAERETERVAARVMRLLSGKERLIEPLTAQEIEILKRCPGRCFAIQEFFSRSLGPFGTPAWPYASGWPAYISRYDALWRQEKRSGGGPTNVTVHTTLNDSTVAPAQRDLLWGKGPQTHEVSPLVELALRLPAPLKKFLKSVYGAFSTVRLVKPQQLFGFIALVLKMKRERQVFRELAELGTHEQEERTPSEFAKPQPLSVKAK